MKRCRDLRLSVVVTTVAILSLAGCTSSQVRDVMDESDSKPAPQQPTAQQPSPQQPSLVDVGANVQSVGNIPASSAAEPSGNFRFLCSFSHLSYDDPIALPGQPGASHLHMFFGNSQADANSTYDSLRASGDGSCAGGAVNRSAYWTPAMLDGAGKVVVADLAVIYYKGSFGGLSGISQIPTMPNGLRMIAGYNMADAGAQPHMYWYCESKGPQQQAGAAPTAMVSCPAGDHVIARQEFPPCWDGVNLDSADHRSHMSYVVYDPNTGAGACPATHPVHLPEYTIAVYWRSDGAVGSWKLSSDTMAGMTHAPGSTFHSDWFGAWDPAIQAVWTKSCVNLLRNCNGGELGDGRRLTDPPTYGGALVVDPPVKP
jgi:Domain of unknown function (DUF1996)